jgi:hypothetical protein
VLTKELLRLLEVVLFLKFKSKLSWFKTDDLKYLLYIK